MKIQLLHFVTLLALQEILKVFYILTGSTIIHTLAAANPDALNISSTDIIMPIAPMFHANAWGIPYVANMVGAKLVLPGRHLDGESVYNLLDQRKGYFTAAVPTIWLMLFEYLDKKLKKLDYLKKLRNRRFCLS